MSIDYIRTNYNVPAKVGGRVEYTGGKTPRQGTITGAAGAHLLIKMDGDHFPMHYHPTWELRYLAAGAAQQEQST